MAEKVIIGISTKTDKKGIDELNSSVKTLSTSVGGLNDNFEEVSDSGEDMQKRIDAAISKLADAKSIADIKTSLREIKSLQIENGDVASPSYKKLAEAAGQANDKLSDMNALIASTSGEPIDNLKNSFRGVGDSIKSLDFKSAKAQFSVLKDSAKALASEFFGGFNALKSYRTAMESGAKSTEALSIATKGFGKALAATGIGLIVIAVASLIANFDKLRTSGGLIGKTLTAIGDTVKFVTESFFKLTDAIGLTDKANQDSFKQTISNIEDRLKYVNRYYDNLKGKTAEQEKERLNLLIKNYEQEVDAFRDKELKRIEEHRKTGKGLAGLDEEEKKQYNEAIDKKEDAQKAYDDFIYNSKKNTSELIRDLDRQNNLLEIQNRKESLQKQIDLNNNALKNRLKDNKEAEEQALKLNVEGEEKAQKIRNEFAENRRRLTEATEIENDKLRNDYKKKHLKLIADSNIEENNLENEAAQVKINSQIKTNEQLLKEQEAAEQRRIDLKKDMDQMAYDLADRMYKSSETKLLNNYSTTFGKIQKFYTDHYSKLKAQADKDYEAKKKYILENTTDTSEQLKQLTTLAKSHAQDEIDIEKKKNDDILAAKKEQFDKYVAIAQTLTNTAAAIGDIFTQVQQNKIDELAEQTDIERELTDQRINEIDRETEAKLAAVDAENISDDAKAAKKKAISDAAIALKNAENRRLFQLEMANFTASEALRKKQFEREKAFKIANAVIATAAGVIATAMDPKLIAAGINIPLSIALGVAGAAQIATIAATQFDSGTPPKFEELYPSVSGGGGGNVPPNTSTTAGQQKMMLQPDQLQYMKVFVSEADIRSVGGKVDVIEQRNIIR